MCVQRSLALTLCVIISAMFRRRHTRPTTLLSSPGRTHWTPHDCKVAATGKPFSKELVGAAVAGGPDAGRDHESARGALQVPLRGEAGEADGR